VTGREAAMISTKYRKSAVRQWLAKHLAYTLLPGHCVLCRQRSGRAIDLCANCDHDLPRIAHSCKICNIPLPDYPPHDNWQFVICANCLARPPTFARVNAAFLYRPPIDYLLWRFKFGGDLAVGKVLGQLLANHIELTNTDLIAPVPLHWRRHFTRGFNQSYELAVTVGDVLNAPLCPNLLRRSIHTPTQQGLNRRQRQKNLHNSFRLKSLRNRKLIEEKAILVVDDVVTTGSTVEEIARLLLSEGAASVEVATVARTPLAN
jgi:ComF family protein